MGIKAVSHKISMLKSLLWRIMGVVILGLVTYYFTNDWVITTKIAIAHHLFFLFVFYAHERIWTLFKNPTRSSRNMIKAFVYEIILGMGFGGLIVFLFTDSFPMVTKITGTYTIIKLITYFIYDKAWPEFKIKEREKGEQK